LIRRTNPNLNFAPAPIPQIRDTERSVDGGYAYGFAVPRASANPGGALTAAYLLASPEASKALATAFGVAPARRDVLAQPAEGNDDESVTSGAAKVSEAVQRADAALREATQ
jgi:hypothetical protein